MLKDAIKIELTKRLNLQGGIRAGYHKLPDRDEFTVNVMWFADISYFDPTKYLIIGRIYKEHQEEGFIGIYELKINSPDIALTEIHLIEFESFVIENQEDKVREALKSINLLNFDTDAYFGKRTFNFELNIVTWSSSITLSSLHTIEPSIQILWKALFETAFDFAEQCKNEDILAFINRKR